VAVLSPHKQISGPWDHASADRVLLKDSPAIRMFTGLAHELLIQAFPFAFLPISLNCERSISLFVSLHCLSH